MTRGPASLTVDEYDALRALNRGVDPIRMAPEMLRALVMAEDKVRRDATKRSRFLHAEGSR